MRCAIKIKNLSLYLDGRYRGRKAAKIEGHISGCDICRKRMENLRLLRASLQELKPVKESEGFDFEFNRALEERLKRRGIRIFDLGLADALARMRENVFVPLPAAVKVAVSFSVLLAVVWGVRIQAIQKQPTVEFLSGDIKIYRPASGTWMTPKAGMHLKAGDRIKAEDGAILNIASKERYKTRIKDRSSIVISRLESGWRNIDTNFSISYGNLLVNTTDKFKGSNMKIYTPACDAEVVGTAFMVKVLPELENRTWLGVLEGRVKVISKIHPLRTLEMKETVTFISSGQKVEVPAYGYPTVPELCSEGEWRKMQELYQLTDMPQLMLIMGTDSDRIEEFLIKPVPIYIPDIERRNIPRPIQDMVDLIIKAAQESNGEMINNSAKELEGLLKGYPSPKYDVEMFMFMASNYHYIKDYDDAIRIFKKVITEYPHSSYASLAQCAIATIYQQDLKDTKEAEKAYKELLEFYPESVDAIRAKEVLGTIR